MDLNLTLNEKGVKARASTKSLLTSNELKNQALLAIYNQIILEKPFILSQNKIDLNTSDPDSPLVKRLELTEEKFHDMTKGILDIISFDDPVGKIDLAKQLTDDLNLYRVSCPIGVLLVIFEARPEVIVQVSCLALKSGNAVLLKGGSEAHHTNSALHAAIHMALDSTGISPDAVQLVATRAEIGELLKMDKYIDLVIPRGSGELVRYCKENTRIPVLGHADGICTVYVDQYADIDMAIKVIIDGKITYPAACNATEKVLIHQDVVSKLLLPLCEALITANVVLYLSTRVYAPLEERFPELVGSFILKAEQDSHKTEFLGLFIFIDCVDSLDEAIEHINVYGSGHTDCIVTGSQENTERFMMLVDSAGVYLNTSTRFADGFRYGFGAEVGVSTNKVHARGPVGIHGLLIYKYRMYGKGHVTKGYKLQQKDIQKSLPLNLL